LKVKGHLTFENVKDEKVMATGTCLITQAKGRLPRTLALILRQEVSLESGRLSLRSWQTRVCLRNGNLFEAHGFNSTVGEDR